MPKSYIVHIMNKIRVFCYLILLLLSFKSSAQLIKGDSRLGVYVGTTNYITDTNLLFSKSGIGYSFGLTTSAGFTEKLHLIVEIGYNRHRMKFVGRETPLSNPEDINFYLEEFTVPFIMNYYFLEKGKFKIGANAGASINMIHDIRIADDSKSDYLLEPLQMNPNDLMFDTQREQMSLNTFLIFGVNTLYNDLFMASFRYYSGITDPYRHAPVYSNFIDISGKDSYFTFTITYYIPEKG